MGVMQMLTFNKDEDGYLSWVREHPLGYVINAPKDHASFPNTLHRASCSFIQTPKRTNYTNPHYIKLCSQDRQELITWGESSPLGLRLCKHCKP